jgi:hypothetical protein
MRTVVLALVALTVGTATASGQDRWRWEQFFQDSLTRDFGSVPRGTQLFYRFKMRNIYAVPLEVSARVGCNCVTVTPLSQVLQPKEEGHFDVTMDSSRFTGQKTVNLYITAANADYASSTTLRVSAYSRTDVVVNPGQINFGVVPRGQATAQQSIDVEYAGVLAWRVSEVIKQEAPLDVTFRELYRRPGQVGYQVTVAIKPDAPPGLLKHELLLKTNDPASPLVPILVEANIQASISVAPNPVRLQPMKVGEAVTKLVVVRATRPFRILAVEGQEDGVAVDLPTAAAQVQVLKLKFQPVKPGDVRRQLRIKTDLDQEGIGSVTLEGTVEP